MRTRLCLYVLLFVPLAVYWQTVFPTYGLGADYSAIRQAREEPGSLVREHGAVGVPVRGALLETTFSAFTEVDQLKWVRLATVLMLTIFSVALWRQLHVSGWGEVSSAAVSVGLVLLPSSQVFVAGASHWPSVLALLLALAGFSAIETEIERGGLKRVIALVGGCMIYAAAGLVDQVSVLFAAVIMTAILLARTGREPLRDIWWCLFHVVTLAAGLALSAVFSQVLAAQGIFSAGAAPDASALSPADYFRYPLPNALGLYALNDDHGHGAVWYWSTVGVVVLVLAWACRLAVRGDDRLAAPRLTLALTLLVAATLAVCAISRDPAAYGSGFPISALVLVLVVHAGRLMLRGRKVRRGHHAALVVLVAAVAVLANRSSFLLLAQPQAREWELVNGAVLRASFAKPVRVHVVRPTMADRSTERVYRQEFGSLSSQSEAVAKDMFTAALHSRFQGKLPAGSGTEFRSSQTAPEASSYDLLINLRRLAEFRR